MLHSLSRNLRHALKPLSNSSGKRRSALVALAFILSVFILAALVLAGGRRGLEAGALVQLNDPRAEDSEARLGLGWSRPAGRDRNLLRDASFSGRWTHCNLRVREREGQEVYADFRSLPAEVYAPLKNYLEAGGRPKLRLRHWTDRAVETRDLQLEKIEGPYLREQQVLDRLSPSLLGEGPLFTAWTETAEGQLQQLLVNAGAWIQNLSTDTEAQTLSQRGLARGEKVRELLAWGQDFYLLSDSGLVYRSADAGLHWERRGYNLPQQREQVGRYTALAATDQAVYGLNAGQLYQLEPSPQAMAGEELDGVELSQIRGLGPWLLALDKRGQVHRFQEQTKKWLSLDGRDIVSLSSSPQSLYAEDRSGQFYRLDSQGQLKRLEILVKARPEGSSVLPFFEGQVLLLEGGRLSRLGAGGTEDLSFLGRDYQQVWWLGPDQILLQNKRGELSQIRLRWRLSWQQGAGDKSEVPAVPELEDQLLLRLALHSYRLGEDSAAQLAVASPLSLEASCLNEVWKFSAPSSIRLATERGHGSYLQISPGTELGQDLLPGQSREGEPSPYYDLSLELRASQSDAQLQLQLEGDLLDPIWNIHLKQGQWTRLSRRFYLRTAGAERPKRLRIKLDGSSGALDLCRLQLQAPVQNSQEELLLPLAAGGRQEVPLRLEGLGLGFGDRETEQWLDDSPSSVLEHLRPLGTAADSGKLQWSLYPYLKSCNREGFTPWISIDSGATEQQLQELLAYLAGPADTELGSRRLKQGMAVPWTSVFRRIYLEWRDEQGLFQTAEERSKWLQHMRLELEQSPYYAANKNRFIFVDGLDYQGQDLHSPVDYHSMEYSMLEEAVEGGRSEGDKKVLDAAQSASEDRPEPSEAEKVAGGAGEQEGPVDKLAGAVQHYRQLAQLTLDALNQQKPRILDVETRVQGELIRHFHVAGDRPQRWIFELLYAQQRWARMSLLDSSLLQEGRDLGQFLSAASLSSLAPLELGADHALFSGYNAQGQRVWIVMNLGEKALRLQLNMARPDGLQQQIYNANLQLLLRSTVQGSELTLLPQHSAILIAGK